MINKICKICNKPFKAKHHKSLFCGEKCRKKGLCQNTKNYSIRKNNRCISCNKLIGYNSTRCHSCATKLRHKESETFGFYKGHQYHRNRTEEGLRRMAEKISKLKRGVHLDTSHLKQYQFQKNHIPWNKNKTGYKLKKL